MILAATTGEGLTIDEDETERLTAIVATEVAGRIPVYLGLSGSDTRKVVKALAHTAPWPVDGYLIACPYYTRPSQEGLYHHFAALAGETARPIMIYNIPYRTGVNLANDTLLRLAELPNIVGVKDCCADQVQSFDLMRARPEGFAVMTGEDALFYAALTQGGDGAILASAHVETARFAAIRQNAASRRPPRALQAWRGLVDVARLLFAEPSPAPIKHWLVPRRADRQSRSPRSDDAGQRGACGADRAGNGTCAWHRRHEFSAVDKGGRFRRLSPSQHSPHLSELRMTFPRASTALNRFTVLDLTRVRAGPTCVRQLADWGANCIKIEMPDAHDGRRGDGRPARGVGLPEPAPQQARDHAEPEIAGRRRGAEENGREGRRRGGEFPPRREASPRHRLRGALRRQSAARSMRAFRASGRTGRTPTGPASTRSRKAWAG